MRWACAAVLLARVAGHSLLTEPPPRPGMEGNGDGIKLTPFSQARSVANDGCGGTANGDPGFQTPTVAYRPGDNINLRWLLTIPHDEDNLQTGVRVAVHYADDDSFNREENILLGCLNGDSGCGDEDNRASAARLTSLLTLPATKTCNYCTVQFIWAAQNDGGFYLQCADISITENGLLPDFDSLDPETDTNNNGLADGVSGGASNPNESGGSNSGGIAAGVIVTLLVVLAIGYYLKKKGAPSVPKFSGTGGGGGGGGLPEGWTAAVDPSSGRTYYVNSKTGETSWDKPGGMMPAPTPPGGAMGVSLPPGWQMATDPASGRTYYVNSVTGATSWEPPRGA